MGGTCGTHGGGVKVKLPLCLTKHHAMKTYWRSGGIAPRILDLGTRWRWVVSFTPRPLYPRERAPGAHWIGGWVGPKAVLDAEVKRKIPSPRRESKPRTPNVQTVAQRYTDWAITALASGRVEVFIGFWLGGPKGRDHCEDLGVGGRITLSWTLEKQGSMRLIGFS
jgi:hypothetical protein